MKSRDLAKIINFYARFMPTYTKTGYWARRLTWGSDKPLDFTGQTWLVTGASAGLGQCIGKALRLHRRHGPGTGNQTKQDQDCSFH